MARGYATAPSPTAAAAPAALETLIPFNWYDADTTLWTPSYTPSAPQGYGVDCVDEKIPLERILPLMFVSTYNITSSASKRMNIGLEPPTWRVVFHIENVKNGSKVRYTEREMDDLYRALPYINNQMMMNDCSSSDIGCGNVTLSIIPMSVIVCSGLNQKQDMKYTYVIPVL